MSRRKGKHAELVKMLALEGAHERSYAYLVARMLKARSYQAAGALIDSFGSRRLWFLDLVADAIKDGEKWQPTTARRRQIEAWDAAYTLAGRGKEGFDAFAKPTLNQVKQQFKRLFPKEKPPADKTFERTFRELKLPWIKSQPGRPKGSKDSDKRRRRYNWEKKRVAPVANFSGNMADGWPCQRRSRRTNRQHSDRR